VGFPVITVGILVRVIGGLEVVVPVSVTVEAGAWQRCRVAGAAVTAWPAEVGACGVVVVAAERVPSSGAGVAVAVLRVPRRVRRVVVIPLLLPAALAGLRAGDG